MIDTDVATDKIDVLLANTQRNLFQVLASMPPDLVARAKDVIYNVCRY